MLDTLRAAGNSAAAGKRSPAGPFALWRGVALDFVYVHVQAMPLVPERVNPGLPI